jgi:hypothetical protein
MPTDAKKKPQDSEKTITSLTLKAELSQRQVTLPILTLKKLVLSYLKETPNEKRELLTTTEAVVFWKELEEVCSAEIEAIEAEREKAVRKHLTGSEE